MLSLVIRIKKYFLSYKMLKTKNKKQKLHPLMAKAINSITKVPIHFAARQSYLKYIKHRK